MMKFNENDFIHKNLSVLEQVNNPTPERQKVIKEIKNFVDNLPKERRSIFIREPYSKGFYNCIEKIPKEIQKVLIDKLKNESIVDIGCGLCDYALLALDKFGIKEYIGIDNSLPGSIKEENCSKKNHNYEINYIESDMLIFLAQLPDNSVNIIMNGIDQTIIKNHQYWEKLKEEIIRVIKSGGIFTGNEVSYSPLIESPNFKKLYSDKNNKSFFLFEKNK